MKNQGLLIALTVLNLVLLACSLVRTDAAPATHVAPVLRGHALEIVDDHGRVRASIAVMPADPDFKMPDGTTGYPETVLLRLMTSEGRPNVKLGTSVDGAGLGLGGQSDPTYVQVLAQRDSTLLRLINKDGREQVVKP
jgi:hypothetical protein